MYRAFSRKCVGVTLSATTAFVLALSPVGALGKEVTVGVAGSSSMIALLAFNVARTKNFIKNRGIDLNVIDFGAGSKGVQAFVTGDVDFVLATAEHSIELRSRGIPAKSVVALSVAPGIALLVAKPYLSSYKDVTDLVGKNVGVTAPGSAAQTFLNFFLRSKGVNPKDVSVLGVGAAGGAVAAIQTGGQLQALVNYDPVISMLEQSGAAQVVIDLRDLKKSRELLGTDFTFLNLITNDKYIQANPGTVQELVSGIVEALKWMQTATPEQVLAAVPEEFWKANRDLYLQSIKSNLTGVSPDGQLTLGDMQGVYKILLSQDPNVDVKKVNFADTFDNRFAAKANVDLGERK
jgi:NitT/TauT family transport system substrate-binding protein